MMKQPLTTLIHKASFLAVVVSLGSMLGDAKAQVYTSPANGNFTNIQNWNFGLGPIPFSSPAGILEIETYGAGALSATNDLQLTLNQLLLDNYSTGALTLNNSLSGAYAFEGAAVIQMLGDGATTALSAPLVIGEGASSLSFTGGGAASLTISGVIASSDSGTPININGTQDAPSLGIVALNGANTFTGNVVLNSGNLSLGNNAALGDSANTLIVNGGTLQGNATIANNITLNSDLNITGGTGSLTLGGVISGSGGIVVRPSGAGVSQNLTGVNTYTGATLIGGIQYVPSVSADNAGLLRLKGAMGSIENTSSITISDGGAFEIDKANGDSSANLRVNGATPINVTSGFVQVMGSTGTTSQNFGTITGSGATTIIARASAANASTSINIGNLTRSLTPGLGNGTFVFSGQNLGNAAAAPGTQVANINLGQLNGVAPMLSLVGGGGLAGTTNVSILPFALGDSSNLSSNFGAGTGFVTYGTNGVRLLDALTEYNLGNNLNLAVPTDNIRITAAPTALAAPVTVNSLFFATTGLTQGGGANPLTITSGALASNVASATISTPVNFPGEAVVSVIGGLGNSNTLTLSGAVTAPTFTKAGQGTVVLSGAGNTIGGALTLNGGWVSVPAIVNLGGATAINANMHSFSDRGGLIYTGAGTDTLATPIQVNSGHMQISATSATGVLNLNSNISGDGGMNYAGNAGSMIVLGGNNSYKGGTRIGSGIVRFNGTDARFGASAGGITINGGTIDLTGAWNTARNISLEGALTLATNGNNSNWSGAILGSGAIAKNGSGTLTISGGENPYSGIITLGAGSLALSGAGELNSASVTMNSAGTSFNISAASGDRSINALNGSSGTSSVALGANNLIVGSGTYAGAIGSGVGVGKIIKAGTGTLTLSGTNTYEGGTEIRGGTLSVSSDTNLGNAAGSVSIRGGIFNSVTSAISTSRAFTLGNSTGALTAAITNGFNTGSNLTINGAINGAGGFNKTGAGILTLGSANGYLGDTQISTGTLSFSADSQLGGASSRILLNGGTLSLSAGNVSTAREIHAAVASTLTVAGTNLTMSGKLAGTTGLTKTGAGTLTLSGNSPSYTGTITVGNGTNATGNLLLTGSMSRGGIALAANSAATLDMSGLTRELGGVSAAAGTTLALGTGGSLTAGYNNSPMLMTGNITGSATASITKVGTGVMTIASNANTFGGGVNVYMGGFTVNGAGVLPLQTVLNIGAWGDANGVGSTLTLSNVTAGTDRIANTQDVHLNSSHLSFSGNAGTVINEQIRTLNGSGFNTVTMSGNGRTLSFTDATNALRRINNGTFLFRGANLGTGVASGTVPNLLFANLPGTQLIGGGGAGGTKTISILPYAIGDTAVTATDTGDTFATYGANGIRLLTTAEFEVSLAASAATENVRVTASETLPTVGSDTTINSLVIAGASRIQGTTTEKLIVTSGSVLSATASVSNNASGTLLGLHMAELQTGAGNTRELNVFTPADLLIGSKITTSGGLTKSGVGHLVLSNAGNTYTGTTTVNGGNLVVDSLGALGGSTSITLGGGYLRYRGSNATLTQPIVLAGASAANPGLGGGINVTSGTILDTAAASVSGFGGLIKDGTGTFQLHGINTYTGATILRAGILSIDNTASLGSSQTVLFGESSISNADGAILRFDSPLTLSHDFAHIGGLTGVGFIFDTYNNDVTLNGNISTTPGIVSRGIVKFGNGDLELTSTVMSQGAAQVFGGSLTLSGNGSLVNSTGTGGYLNTNTYVVNPGGSLILDNAATNNNNRLADVYTGVSGTGDAASGSLRLNGAELKLIGNGVSGTSEVINRIDLGSGVTVTLDNSGAQTVLTSGRVNLISEESSGLIRGDNLGATPAATSTNWYSVDMGGGSVTLGGANGSKGSPYVSILPGFMFDTSATGEGTDLGTYDTQVGFRPLTAGEYASSIPLNNYDLNRAPNLSLSGVGTVGETTAIAAIKLEAGSGLSGAGTLQLTQGTVLATGSATIDVPALSANMNGSTDGYYFLTPGASTVLTVNSVLASDGLVKIGAGDMVLTGPYTGSGNVVISQGTMELSGMNAGLNPLGSSVIVQRGATLDLGGGDRTISNLATTALIGSFNMNQASDGTVNLGSNTLKLYDEIASSTFTGDITGNGGISKLLYSTGITTFTQPLAYSGVTRVMGGTLQLAGQGSVLNSSLIDVRGGNLTFNNSDDNAVSGYVAQRISASTPVNLAGTLAFTSNANAPANHNLGTVTLVGGATVNVTPGTNAPTTITMANLARSADKGTLTVTNTGSELGFTQSPVGNTRILLTQVDGAAPASALVGGGGLDGTQTISILPWAFSSTAGHFMTYNATNGLRPLLATAAESGTSLNVAAGDVNVRATAAQALSAAREVNSLVQTTGGVTGNFDLTLRSGALAATVGNSIGNVGTTNSLRTGVAGADNRELVIMNTGATTLNYRVGTTAGVTKYGGGVLTLAGTNTFTGGLNINQGQIQYASDANLGGAGGAIRFGGAAGGASAPPPAALNYNGTSTFVFNRPVTTNAAGTFITTNNNLVFQMDGVISGAGSVGYNSGNTIFEINATNTYTGGTHMENGHFSILNDAAFGNGGEITMDAATSQNIILRGDWDNSRLINIEQMGLTTNGYDATWNGTVVGTGNLNKNGNGSLVFTGASPAGVGLTVNAGTVRLTDRGSFAAGSQTVNSGAEFTLDDSGVHSSDRLNDVGGTVSLQNGRLNLIGSSTALTEEVIFDMGIDGQSTLSITAGGGQAAILRINGTLTHDTGNGVLFRGTNLGQNIPGTPNVASILLNRPSQSSILTGGGGPADNPAISVIAGAFGDTTATGLGSQLVTYDVIRGIRTLNPSTEFTGTLSNGTSMDENVHLDATGAILANATRVNALWLENSATITGAGALTLTAGNILVTGAANSIANPLTAGSNALSIGGSGNLTLSGSIPLTHSGGLIKTGAGILTLPVANSYLGGTILSSGSIVLGSDTALSGGTVRILGGSVEGSGTRTITNNIALSGTMTIAGSSDMSFSGAFSIENATRALNVTNSGTKTISGVISQTAGPAIGLTKSGSGLLVLTNANTYGPNTNGNYYLSTTTVEAGELRINNLSGSGTGGSMVVVDAGATLSGTGFIVPTQSTEARNTITISGTLSGGLPVTDSAPGILTMGSATSPGITTASLILTGTELTFYHNTLVAPTPAALNSGLSGLPGLDHNMVRVHGSFAELSPATLTISLHGDATLFDPLQTYSYKLVDADTMVSPFNIYNIAQFDVTNFAGFNPATHAIYVETSGQDLYLNIVPEPSSFILLGSAAALLGMRRRRKL